MSDKIKMAHELHAKGFNCAQSVAMPFCEELGADLITVAKSMEGFGGGMGGYSLVCGALSGAICVAGLSLADGNLENPASKRTTYSVADTLCKRFTAECGSHLCPEIKGLGGGPMLKSCKDCIETGVRLAQEVIGK